MRSATHGAVRYERMLCECVAWWVDNVFNQPCMCCEDGLHVSCADDASLKSAYLRICQHNHGMRLGIGALNS